MSKHELKDMAFENAKLYILGIADEGCQAVQYFQGKSHAEGVTLVAIDSDADRLAQTNADITVLIDMHRLTRDENGALTALAKYYLLKRLIEHIDPADAFFILPGLRNPESELLSTAVCQLIAEQFKLAFNAFVLAIVDEPGQDESLSVHQFFQQGYEKLVDQCDCVITNPCRQISPALVQRQKARIDHQAIKSITDLVINQAQMFIGFSDVASVFAKTREAIFAVGVSTGEHRATQAINNALADLRRQWGDLSHPDINAVLINIRAAEISMLDFNAVGNAIHPIIDEDSLIKISTTIDETIPAEEMQIAVILAKSKPKKV